MNKTHCLIMLLYSSKFMVDSVFEGEMKHRINFVQPYLGMIFKI